MPLPIAYRPTSGGSRTSLDISTTTQVTTGQSHVCRVFIVTSPTAAGGIYDSATVAGVATANEIQAIPAGATLPLVLDCEVFNGLVIDPGTGGVVSVSYDPPRSF